ncbi:uncharacterized protein O3C94_003818 [Discoglossus pictus]
MAALEIQEDDLEDLLVYDDLFLEYFNTFLALPAFPVRLFYDRLTGDVQELDGDRPQGYGPSDQQKERTLCWLREHRLPLFRRSPLYLEYKLAKLLLRPLADPHPLCRYDIRGYSRQSNSAALSTIPSHPSTAASHLLSNTIIQTGSLFPRVPSRTQSCPAATGYLSDISSLMEPYGDVILRLYNPLHLLAQESLFAPMFVDNGKMPVSDSGIGPQQGNDATSLESPGPHQTLSHLLPADCDDGRKELVDQDMDVEWSHMDDSRPTHEEETFLQAHNLTWSSLQQMKEEALGTKEGMQNFIDFLHETLGIYLLHFWLNCEEFKECSKDLEANHNPEEARHLSVHLFRSIQGKYQPYLSPECQEEIRVSQQTWGPTFHTFRKPQYDALRRLRSYWVPRFIIHQQTLVRDESEVGQNRRLSSLVTSQTTLSANGSPRRKRQCKGKKGQDSKCAVTDRSSPNRTQSNLTKTCSQLLFHKMLPALQSDREAGEVFLHYLKRFEPPQKTQALFLWQKLDDFTDSKLELIDCTCPQHQATGHTNGISSYPILSRSTDFCSGPPVQQKKTQSLLGCCEGLQHSDLGSAARVALGALCEPYIRFLHYDITSFLEYCVPLSYNETQKLEGREGSPVQTQHTRVNKQRSNEKFGLQEGHTRLRRKKEQLVLPSQMSQFIQEHEPRAILELLQHKSIYRVYRKAVQATEEPELLKALEILHALKSVKAERKIMALVQRVLELDSIQIPLMKGLRKRLAEELLKGRIGKPCLEEITTFLSCLLAESFDNYWKEVMERLKDYGIEQPTDDDWTRLGPILQVITTKMVMKRLHSRKGNTSYAAQVKPTEEDLATFHESVQVAAEGWPTLEILHFLDYLQIHGPHEGLPLLENNLLCCLEIQKYRNAHHPMPDKELLKRKVKVIRDRFLTLHANTVLQVPRELLESILIDIEHGIYTEIPYVSIFDHLREVLYDSLLSFWAAFRKVWHTRSPASAQRAPVLQVQQMLRRRLALFQAEEDPPKTFHLPPVIPSPEKKPQSPLTYSFSVSRGVSLKDDGTQDRASQTPPAGSRRMSLACELPPIPGISQEMIETVIPSI